MKTQKMVLHNRKYLKENRKELRAYLTLAEAELWRHLKSGQLSSRKFRRQHSVGNFILDFYCPAERLAIELDGQVHQNSNAEHFDTRRDLILQNLGIKVIRFENKDVFENLERVMHEICENFKT